MKYSDVELSVLHLSIWRANVVHNKASYLLLVAFFFDYTKLDYEEHASSQVFGPDTVVEIVCPDYLLIARIDEVSKRLLRARRPN